MRLLPLSLLVLAVGCVAFAYWGVSTTSGRRAFDEMAGMIPMGVGALGILLAIAAAIVWWMGRRAP
jgi:hypothetical protein